MIKRNLFFIALNLIGFEVLFSSDHLPYEGTPPDQPLLLERNTSPLDDLDQSSKVLFQGNDLSVVYEEFDSKDVCISFSHYIGDEDCNRVQKGDDPSSFINKPFAKELLKNRINAIYIIANKNHWYQTQETIFAIGIINDFLLKFNPDRIIGLGLSMGGYGCLLTSSLINYSFLILLSPQVTIKNCDFLTALKKYIEKAAEHIFIEEPEEIRTKQIYCYYGNEHINDKAIIQTQLIPKIKSEKTLIIHELPTNMHNVFKYLKYKKQEHLIQEIILSKQYIPHQFDPELPKALYQLVYDFQAIMDYHQIPFFFSSGTLLGAVRHGGLIPWDDDADCCLLGEYIDCFIMRVIPEFVKIGYEISFADDGWRGFKIYLLNQQKNKINTSLDVFFLQFDKNFLQYVYPSGWPHMILKKDQIFPLQKIQFGNLQISAPKDIEGFLTDSYGENWKTCIQKYNHLFAQLLSEADKEPVLAEEKTLLPAGPFGPLRERGFESSHDFIRGLPFISQQITDLPNLTRVDLSDSVNLFSLMQSKKFYFGNNAKLSYYDIVELKEDNLIIKDKISPNESFWKIIDGKLYFYNQDYIESSIFYFYNFVNDHRLLLMGRYVLESSLCSEHYLLEVRG
jgi:lipopolysaccharide cholinephosphotransferase